MAVVATALFVTGGCAGSASTPVGSASSDPTTPQTARQHPARVAADADLSGFACEPQDSGNWRATGTLTNSTAHPAAYAVSVVVTAADATAASGKRRTVAPLSAGRSTTFTIAKLAAPVGVEPSCAVRVTRLR